MQNHFGAVRSEERYNVDADLLREIKQVSHHICTVNRSMPYTDSYTDYISFSDCWSFLIYFILNRHLVSRQTFFYKMKLSALHSSSTE